MSLGSARSLASAELPVWPAKGPVEAHWQYRWNFWSWGQVWDQRPTMRQQRLLTLHWRQRQAYHRLQAWDRSFLPDAVTVPALFTGLLMGLASLLSFLPRGLLLSLAMLVGGTILAVLGRAMRAHHQARHATHPTPWRVFWDEDAHANFPPRPWLVAGGIATVLGISTGVALAAPTGVLRLSGLVSGGAVVLSLIRSGLLTMLGARWHLSTSRLMRHAFADNHGKARQRIGDMAWAWPCELPPSALREAWRARGLTDVEAYIERAHQSPVGWTRWDQAMLRLVLCEGPEYLPYLGANVRVWDTPWGITSLGDEALATSPEAAPVGWAEWLTEGQHWPALMPLKRVLRIIQGLGDVDIPPWLRADLPRLWALHQQAHATQAVPRLPDKAWFYFRPELTYTDQEVSLAWIVASLSAPMSWWSHLFGLVPPCAPENRSPAELLWRLGTDAVSHQWEHLKAIETGLPNWVAPADYLNLEACHGSLAQVERRLAQVPPADRYPFLKAWAHPEPIGNEPVLAEPSLARLVEGLDLDAWWSWHQTQVEESRQQEARWSSTDPAEALLAYPALDRLSHYATTDQQRRWLAECPEGALPTTLARVRAADLASRPAPPAMASARRRV